MAGEPWVFGWRQRGGGGAHEHQIHRLLAVSSRWFVGVHERPAREHECEQRLAPEQPAGLRAQAHQQRMPAMPTARGSLGGAVVIKGELLIVAGGEEPTGVLGAVEGYSISDEEWSALPDLPTARHGAGVARLGTSVYVIGGATQPGHSASTPEVEALSFTAGESGGNK